ncbi:hypothetical protein DAH66_12705 [Sphingomonas koreensis]|uniref:Bbp19-like phage domain-containing protein n=1 Tax=Sphingomonas koreensis TaxID=93064 RepID=A0A430G2D0_9SPHN|nr:hypothetical protein [Sphingomonas koreensis]RSY83123.1 hypothetical protein DAH66_12705 [Sphingomonas koreensis]
MSRKQTPHELDMMVLMRSAAFRRFLLRVCSHAGIWRSTAGADQALHMEGRRSLGLDILTEAAAGLPRATSIEHVLAAILVESTPQETPDDDASHSSDT